MSRASADAAVGMMDAAYFIGRKELLDYFNDLLDLNLAKIEQTASGAIACQITELIFPGSIPMSRVNWAARSDYEFVQNYKLLQNAFTKHHVQRHVDVDKLIRAKYQDNLEFCQWLKAFADQAGCHRDDDYDPSAIRVRGKGGAKYNEEMGKKGRGGGRAVATSTAGTARSRALAGGAVRPGAATTTTAARTATSKAKAAVTSTVPLRERTSNPVVSAVSSTRAAVGSTASLNSNTPKHDPLGEAVAADAALMLKNKDLQLRVDDLELLVVETETERNFYFEKLQSVEKLLQIYQEQQQMLQDEADAENVSKDDVKLQNVDILMENVFQILYATADDKLSVNDLGEIYVNDGVADTSRATANDSALLQDDYQLDEYDDDAVNESLVIDDIA